MMHHDDSVSLVRMKPATRAPGRWAALAMVPALLASGCADPSLVGKWKAENQTQEECTGGTIDLEFTGEQNAGNFEQVFAGQGVGEGCQCRYEVAGSFTTSETALTITASSAKKVYTGCQDPAANAEIELTEQGLAVLNALIGGTVEVTDEQLVITSENNQVTTYTRQD